MKRSAIALVPLAAMALALGVCSACGTSTPPSPSPSSSPESGVRGTAKSAGGPVMSGEMSGETNVWPSSNVTVVAHKGEFDGPIVARAVADREGRFSMDLPPGTYTLAQVMGQPKTVTVHAGEYARVSLWQAVP